MYIGYNHFIVELNDDKTSCTEKKYVFMTKCLHSIKKQLK